MKNHVVFFIQKQCAKRPVNDWGGLRSGRSLVRVRDLILKFTNTIVSSTIEVGWCIPSEPKIGSIRFKGEFKLCGFWKSGI
jgi:hypothetical protein